MAGETAQYHEQWGRKRETTWRQLEEIRLWQYTRVRKPTHPNLDTKAFCARLFAFVYLAHMHFVMSRI